MSNNASISAAIRRRGGGDVNVTNRNTVITDNTTNNSNEQKRYNYLDVMINHETRLKDVEALMKESLLPTYEDNTNKIEQMMTTLHEIQKEITSIKTELTETKEETNTE